MKKEMNKKPWGLSIYKDIKGNDVLEVLSNMSSNDDHKYWVHLDFATIVGHLEDTNDKIISKNYPIGFNKYFVPYEQKYIPLDSSTYRVGLIRIPNSAITSSIACSLSYLKTKMGKDLDKINPNIHTYKSVHVEFTFKDDEGHTCTQNSIEYPLSDKRDNGLQLI